MVRYARQYNDYTCGPIAIINAIKWSGHKGTLKNDLKRITQECRCDRNNGTSHGNFDHVLRQYSRGRFTARRRLYPDFSDVVQHLAHPNCAVIINYLHVGEITDAHYVLLLGGKAKNGRGLTLINSFSKETRVEINEKQIKEYLKKRRSARGKMYPRVWFLQKPLE